MQGVVRRQKNAVRAIGQERTQAFEVAAKGGDDQHAHVAEPADFCGKARGFAAATAAKDDLWLVAVFDGIRRRRGFRYAGFRNQAAQAGIEMVAAGGERFAVVEQAAVVGGAVGTVCGRSLLHR